MDKSFRKLFVLAILLLVYTLMFPSTVASTDNNPETNKETLIAFHKAEANKDYDTVASYVSENFARHSVATMAIMPDTVVTNRDEYLTFLQASAETFPDYVTTPQILVAEGDYVAFYSVFTGTFIANGNRINMPMSGVVRFEDGLMAEMWIEWDNVTWDMQMNAVESPVESIDDMVGVWEIFVDGYSYRIEFTDDSELFVVDPTLSGYIDHGNYDVIDNQYTDDSNSCVPVYDVYVTRQSNGIKRSLRFDLVGEDCYKSRRQALAGQTIYPYVND